MDNIVGRLQSCLSSNQIDVVIGSLLGDARLECRSIGKRHAITARLRIHHSEKQKEYVFWKYETFKNLVSEGPRRIKVWHDPKRNRDHYSWYFHTRSTEEFGELYHYFYRSGIKILPDSVFDFITPRALAVWFMDDGSNTKESFTMNTHCFSKDEQEKIITFLTERHSIPATMVKDRSKYKIAIGRFGYEAFTRIIEPFIISSMIYKIDNPRNDSPPKAEELRSTKLLLLS